MTSPLRSPSLPGPNHRLCTFAHMFINQTNPFFSVLELQIFTARRLTGFFVWDAKIGLWGHWNISISCISHKAMCNWGKHISSQSSCFLISGLSDPMPRCYLWLRRWHHNGFTIPVSNFTPNSFHVPELNWSILKGAVRLFLFVHVRSRCFTVG